MWLRCCGNPPPSNNRLLAEQEAACNVESAEASTARGGGIAANCEWNLRLSPPKHRDRVKISLLFPMLADIKLRKESSSEGYPQIPRLLQQGPEERAMSNAPPGGVVGSDLPGASATAPWRGCRNTTKSAMSQASNLYPQKWAETHPGHRARKELYRTLENRALAMSGLNAPGLLASFNVCFWSWSWSFAGIDRTF